MIGKLDRMYDKSNGDCHHHACTYWDARFPEACRRNGFCPWVDIDSVFKSRGQIKTEALESTKIKRTKMRTVDCNNVGVLVSEEDLNILEDYNIELKIELENWKSAYYGLVEIEEQREREIKESEENEPR